MEFKNNGIMRSFGVTKCIELTFRNVFNRKKRSIGRKIVRRARANNFAFITGTGINRGDFEK
jgi:hypothetical protein